LAGTPHNQVISDSDNKVTYRRYIRYHHYENNYSEVQITVSALIVVLPDEEQIESKVYNTQPLKKVQKITKILYSVLSGAFLS
jgi:hypothetical protein